MEFTDEQFRKAMDFVRIAGTRPISNERKKQFAQARVQAELKISHEGASELVELVLAHSKQSAPAAETATPVDAPIADAPAAEAPVKAKKKAAPRAKAKKAAKKR